MGDRIDRAERYVLGLMDEAERERAERDLESDPAFREALVEMAERMHLFDRAAGADKRPADKTPSDQWRLLKERIAAMPQMRQADLRAAAPEGQGPEEPGKPVTFGRRRGDRLRAGIAPEAAPPVTRLGPHSVPHRKALLLALALIAAFVLGYVAGRM